MHAMSELVDLMPWHSFMLLGKIWALGYALTILAVVLGIAAVGIPSRRKKEKRRTA